MVYADYSYYMDTFCGSMPPEDFARLSRRASAHIDRVTQDKAAGAFQCESLRGKLCDACCALADVYLLFEQGGGIASETNDGISVNYLAGLSKSKSEGDSLKEAVSLYLGGTGLLYRGTR